MVEIDETSCDDGGFELRRLLAQVENMSELSRITGINRRSLDRYRDGMEPSLTAAAKIARALKMPIDDLVYGPSAHSLGVNAVDDVILIPFLSVHGSAGPGITNNGLEVIDSIPFSRKLLRRYGVPSEKAHAITAKGDSMLPTISDGQTLLIDGSVRRVRQDAIYALSIDDDIRIKRIQRSVGGMLTLKSDNPNYEPELLSPADAEKLRIEGRVFWTEQLL